ncbi:hypothetical protein H5P28_15175 [Ruficoccus amylovorans]|uniref:Glycosyltransferase subfamily 4-like N-terminal domain-containing protein n=1 Tax=Ruficoccus amylovorans TaxID=1804625 RepID=A0A842HHY5_9BACT|nr:glycosyltransferase [Ruficoccus amylovorans]MBC2595608.1 hypothetical protein [Ruficoccus amylovorans]
MRCTIVNRVIHADSNTEWHHATELADYLARRGITVTRVALREPGQPDAPAERNLHLLPRHYSGKHKIRRLLASLLEGRRLIRHALKLDHGPIICMTDPPLLNFWMARETRRRQIPWIYWSLDLYPEAFAAAGLVRRSSPFYRYLQKTVEGNAPSHLLALGPQQAAHIRQQYTPSPGASILPCGIARTPDPAAAPEWARAEGKIILGYVGNLGEAHSDTFVEAALSCLDPKRHRFILAASGAKSARLRELAKDMPAVITLDSVPREHLRFIDIHLVTLLPHWDHICVPSKAVSAVCEGGSILFHGSRENDNWKLLHDAGWRLPPEEKPTSAMKAFFEKLSPGSLREKQQAARKLSSDLLAIRDRAFDDIYRKVKELQ